MKKIFLFFHIIFTIFLSAQNGSLDLTFNPNTVYNKRIRLVDLQPDSKILIVYDEIVGDYFISKIARLNIDGSFDNTFNAELGINYIYSIAVQPDGKILVGGYSESPSINCFFRLNADGSFDNTFSRGAIISNRCNLIFLQPDGKILVIDTIKDIGFYGKMKLTRLNEDGSLDNTFVPYAFGAIGSNNINIAALALLPDGRILAGGSYLNSSSEKNILLRISANGSSSVNITYSSFHAIKDLVVQPDGNILVAAGMKGGSTNSLIRIKPDGSTDNTFSTNYNGVGINDIELQSDGKIIVSGSGSQSVGKLVRYNSDGSIDNTFEKGEVTVWKIKLQKDNKILVGGLFNKYNNISINNIARLNNNIVMSTLDLSKNKEIVIYPNPVKNILNIKSDEPISSYEIYSLNGRKLMEQNKLNNSKIDVSNLTKGNYLIKLKSKGKEQTTKFIKE